MKTKTSKLHYLLLLSVLGWSVSSFASENVAKIIIMKGEVKAKTKDNKTTSVKKGDWLKEGTTLATGPKSFAKLLFVDKSQMNLGPKSQMVISAFPKKKAGIITLMKGQLRSNVSKNYLEMKNKNKSKLFIKTRTAAMGVRGTDFQVNYNPENQNTGLITFSGAVAMVQLDPSGALARSVASVQRNIQNRLERAVSGSQAVMVKKGEFAGSSPKQPRVSAPVKINPAQFDSLKKNDGTKEKSSAQSNTSKKIYRNPIPPGVDSKSFANDAKNIDSQMSAVVGTSAIQAVDREVAAPDKHLPPELTPGAAPGGNLDPAALAGANGLRPGGYIDPDTAQYINPPKDSAFDSVTGTFIPPQIAGGFDVASGDYTNQIYDVKSDGTFEMREEIKEMKQAMANEGPSEPGRSPASERFGDIGILHNMIGAMPETMAGEEFNQFTEVVTHIDPAQMNDPNHFHEGGLMDSLAPAPEGALSPEELEALAQERQEELDLEQQQLLDNVLQANETQVRFNITTAD